MSINIILYQEVFQQTYSQFCFDSFIFLIFGSDTIQVLMTVCPTVSELRFMNDVIFVYFCFLVPRSGEAATNGMSGPKTKANNEKQMSNFLSKQPG